MDIGPSHAREPPDEGARNKGSEQHAYGGEHNTGTQHGLNLAKLGIHTTREKDDAESYHTHKSRFGHVIELQAETIGTEKHTYDKEQQKGGHAKASTGLAHGNANKQQNRTYKEYVSRSNHWMFRLSLNQCNCFSVQSYFIFPYTPHE